MLKYSDFTGGQKFSGHKPQIVLQRRNDITHTKLLALSFHHKCRLIMLSKVVSP